MARGDAIDLLLYNSVCIFVLGRAIIGDALGRPSDHPMIPCSRTDAGVHTAAYSHGRSYQENMSALKKPQSLRL